MPRMRREGLKSRPSRRERLKVMSSTPDGSLRRLLPKLRVAYFAQGKVPRKLGASNSLLDGIGIERSYTTDIILDLMSVSALYERHLLRPIPRAGAVGEEWVET
jgi:hypothetical protein